MYNNRQAGFTLTELLISTTLSLGVISAVLVGYVATSTSTMNTMAASKLNHEMTTMMSLMANDIRRAGYWGALAASSEPLNNPFNVVGQTALTVFDSATGNNAAGVTGNGTCIVFAYDLNMDGTVNANELMGYRLNNGVVQMRTSGTPGSNATCAAIGNTWEDLTDSAHVTVTSLNFDLVDSVCINTREPDEVDNDANGVIDNPEEIDCYRVPLPVAASGDVTVETRQVRITVTGTLVEDSFVRVTQSQIIRVRNELVRVR